MGLVQTMEGVARGVEVLGIATLAYRGLRTVFGRSIDGSLPRRRTLS
jgi:hypothetical protein